MPVAPLRWAELTSGGSESDETEPEEEKSDEFPFEETRGKKTMDYEIGGYDKRKRGTTKVGIHFAFRKSMARIRGDLGSKPVETMGEISSRP